jgi:hypothetical protein
MKTISFETILGKIRDALKNSSAITTFCQTKYAKNPSIYIGFNAAKPPGIAECPVIVIFPGVKTEGEEIDEFNYGVTVAWSIANSATTSSNGVTEFTGLLESSQLGQLIYDVLADMSVNSPITTCDYTIDATMSHPQFPGRMDITFTVPVVIGGDITF